MFEHYCEHKMENGMLTFYQFLHLHYADTNHAADDEHAGKLPFKSHQQLNSFLYYFECVNYDEYSAANNLLMNLGKRLFPKNLPPTSQYLSNIWQPPRMGRH